MVIRKLVREDVTDVARLHIDGISTGFISSLGINFVSSLYGAILESESSFGFVMASDGVVIGFAAVTTNVRELYKAVIFRHGIQLALAVVGKMSSWTRIKNVFETLFYPSRIEKPDVDLPRAELLSIAVKEGYRRRGIGRELVRRSLEECSCRGIGRLKVVTGAFMEGANGIYAECGFGLAGQFENHGIASNVYVAEVESVLGKWREAVSEAAAAAGPAWPEILEISRRDREDERAGMRDDRQEVGA